MFATISIPGGRNFTFKHFDLRGKALDAAVAAWRADWLARRGESQETLNAVRQGFTIRDREAAKVKYLNGRRVFAVGEGV
jgi:hypothetical protein